MRDHVLRRHDIMTYLLLLQNDIYRANPWVQVRIVREVVGVMVQEQRILTLKTYPPLFGRGKF